MHPPANEAVWLAWTQLWQVTALIVAVGVVVRFCCRRRPHLAHLLWMLVIVKCLTPPLWSSPTGIFSWIQVRVIALASERPPPVPAGPSGPAAAWPELPETVPGGSGVSNLPPVARGKPPGRPIPWRAVLLVTWVSGVVVLGALTFRRWLGWRRLLKKGIVPTPPDAASLTAELAKRLRLWRKVRLVVTSEPVGPVTLGVLRPVVLMPEAALRGKSPRQLEPILAHELIHVRRGDTLLGVLQILAQLLWWFHPSVWWANRQSCREAERCCDEEVMAALGCRPSVYVHSLLDLLQLQRHLRPVPALPGARPVEVSLTRLEEIMKRTGRLYRRTPGWCWGVILVVAFAVLPGREWVIDQAKAEVGDLLLTIPNPSGVAEEGLGFSMAPMGNNILVASEHADRNGVTDAGVAYLLDGSTGEVLQTFENPDPMDNDQFGISLAPLGDDKVVIGTRRNWNTDGVGNRRTGVAYVFDVATGQPELTIPDPNPTTTSINFGGSLRSIAAFGDGFLIGSLVDAGVVYHFRADGVLLKTFFNPSPTSNDSFGPYLSVMGDDVLVGDGSADTFGERAGAFYLLDGTSGDLLHTFSDPAPSPGDEFGFQVYADGNTILAGARLDDTDGTDAGIAFAFNRDGSLLQTFHNPTPDFGDQFGARIAIKGDKVLIAAHRDDAGATDAGAAHLFDVPTGALLHTYLNPTPEVDDRFAVRLCFLANGNVAIASRFDDVGNVNSGAVYVFEGPTVIPEPSTLTLLFGGGVCLLIHVRRLRRRRR